MPLRKHLYHDLPLQGLWNLPCCRKRSELQDRPKNPENPTPFPLARARALERVRGGGRARATTASDVFTLSVRGALFFSRFPARPAQPGPGGAWTRARPPAGSTRSPSLSRPQNLCDIGNNRGTRQRRCMLSTTYFASTQFFGRHLAQILHPDRLFGSTLLQKEDKNAPENHRLRPLSRHLSQAYRELNLEKKL